MTTNHIHHCIECHHWLEASHQGRLSATGRLNEQQTKQLEPKRLRKLTPNPSSSQRLDKTTTHRLTYTQLRKAAAAVAHFSTYTLTQLRAATKRKQTKQSRPQQGHKTRKCSNCGEEKDTTAPQQQQQQSQQQQQQQLASKSHYKNKNNNSNNRNNNNNNKHILLLLWLLTMLMLMLMFETGPAGN